MALKNFGKQILMDMLDGDGVKFTVGDKQRMDIQNYFNTTSVLRRFGADLPNYISDINKQSVTFLINSTKDLDWKDKTGIGIKHDDLIKPEKSGFFRKTIYISVPKTDSAAFNGWDLRNGVPSAAALKLAVKLDQFNEQFQIEGMKRLCQLFQDDLTKKVTAANNKNNQITLVDLSEGKTTKKDDIYLIKRKIINACHKLKNANSHKYGLRRFPSTKIFIDLSTELFQLLVDERLIVDKAKVTYEGGIKTIGRLGSYEARENDLLSIENFKTQYYDATSRKAKNARVHAVIGTGVTAASLFKIVSAQTNYLQNLGDDIGYYVQAEFVAEDNQTSKAVFITPVIDLLLNVVADTADAVDA